LQCLCFPLQSGHYNIKQFSLAIPILIEHEKKLISIKNSIPVYKKSGIIAGSLSAIIPGFGKIYAGKPKQGLTTFIPVVLLGLQAYEAYRKGGVENPWFIADSGLFAIFYIGNIWGSALSVSIKRKEIQNDVNDQILLNMHIPLQKLYK
jgi:TM2 domain-containing membrane protein YozV